MERERVNKFTQVLERKSRKAIYEIQVSKEAREAVICFDKESMFSSSIFQNVFAGQSKRSEYEI